MSTDRLFHQLRSVRIGLALILALIAVASSWAADYITDVMVIGGDKSTISQMKSDYEQKGWIFIDDDLNDGAGGDYVHVLYKKSSSNSSDVITDIIIKIGERPDTYVFNGRTYYRAPNDGSEHFKSFGGNLNSSTTVESSTNMRLYYTKEEFPDKRAVSGIAFTVADNNKTKTKTGYTTLGRNGAVVGIDGSGALDLNEGAGSDSKYIYMHISTVQPPLADAPEYITDVVVFGGEKDDVNALKERYASQGWVVIDQDLNDGAGSGTDYVYLAYKKSPLSEDGNGFITDFIIKTGDYPDTYKFNGRTYYRAPNFGSEHFEAHGGNLNSGTVSSSTNMRLYFTREKFPDTRIVSDIAFTIGEDNKTLLGYMTLGKDGATVGSDGSGAFDLNEGAGSGSDYIYMHFATVTYINIVTFVTGFDHVIVAPQEVVLGDTPTRPKDPVRPGFRFMGWYTTAAGDTEFDFSAPVSSNTTVYAKWAPLYSVTFVTGDENVSVPAQTIISGGKPSQPKDPERTGFKFLGWYTTAAGNTKFDFSAPVTGNTTVYAKWESLYYIVEFVSTPSVYIPSISIPSQTVISGSIPTKPSNPKHSGFKFMGWYTTADGDTEFDFSAPITSDTYVYAKWEIPYIDENGKEQVKQPGECTLLTNETKTGNLPGGWYLVKSDVEYSSQMLSSGNLNIILADGASLTVNGNISAKNITIYGQKKRTGKLTVSGIYVTDKVVFNGGVVSVTDITLGEGIVFNGGNVTVNGSIASESNDKKTVSLGWNNLEDRIMVNEYGGLLRLKIADGQAFKDENDNIYSSTMIASKVKGKTLRPSCDTVTITFVTGVDNIAIPPQYVAVSKIPTEPDNPERIGYEFMGWYIFANGNTKFDFSAPLNNNVTIYARWKRLPNFVLWSEIPYIDENGKEQVKQPSEYTVLFDETPISNLPSGWYVVIGEVKYSSQMLSSGDLNIIIADGASLTINDNRNDAISANNVTIYGQKMRTGKLTVTGGIYAAGNVVINGGVVSVTNIKFSEGVVFNGGSIVVNGSVANENNGTKTVILGWNNLEDRIMVKEYRGSLRVKIAEGQAFKDENGNVYSGSMIATKVSGKTLTPSKPLISIHNLTIAEISAQTYTGSTICPDVVVNDGETRLVLGKDYKVVCRNNVSTGVANVTISGIGEYEDMVRKTFEIIPKVLAEYPAIQILENQNGVRAVIDGNYGGGEGESEVISIPQDIVVDKVEMTRDFPTGAYSTVVLPFDVKVSNVENKAHVGGLMAALRYNGIKTVNKTSSIRMKVVWAADYVIQDDNNNWVFYKDTVLNANTPYLVLMNDATFNVNNTEQITLKKTASAEASIDGWTFRGTWEYKIWNNDNDPELGYAYGFAASESKENNISVGDFVKVGKGAWIRPMRAYLVKADKAQAQGIHANGAYVMRPSISQELPEFMNVVIDYDGEGDGEHTTVIGQFNTRTGEFRMNGAATKRTFDVKGRNVGDKANKARGAYYGKKVLK